MVSNVTVVMLIKIGSKEACRICGDCEDPEEERYWVKCETCEQWFHSDCLDIEEEENSNYYECDVCRVQSTLNSSKKRSRSDL